jgi:predicted regulator of Ras-like GTPase activity (Roadblock/LC7/MglB family)
MTLADLSMDTIRAAQAAARFLGQPDRPFEHNMFESDSLRLYAMSLPGELLLTVVTPTSTPLGTIRHNLRRAARELSRLAHG